MAVHLDTRASDFAERFRALLDTKREAAEDVEADGIGGSGEGFEEFFEDPGGAGGR